MFPKILSLEIRQRIHVLYFPVSAFQSSNAVNTERGAWRSKYTHAYIYCKVGIGTRDGLPWGTIGIFSLLLKEKKHLELA